MNDLDFLKESYKIAAQLSSDPSTQNGALLVDDNGKVLAWGANHFPRGVTENHDRWQRPLKYKFVEHAERNAIFHAAEQGVATKDLTMYCAWAACSDCARAIIQSGIKEVVTHHNPCSPTRFGMPSSSLWLEEIKIAAVMFEEAGVGFRWLNDAIGEYEILFNGTKVRP